MNCKNSAVAYLFNSNVLSTGWFLGPRGPIVLPSVGPVLSSVQEFLLPPVTPVVVVFVVIVDFVFVVVFVVVVVVIVVVVVFIVVVIVVVVVVMCELQSLFSSPHALLPVINTNPAGACWILG